MKQSSPEGRRRGKERRGEEGQKVKGASKRRGAVEKKKMRVKMWEYTL